MALMGWNDSYSVGSAMLDSDHRILFKLLNQLDDATDTGQSHDVVASVLSVLAEYTEHHFHREELVMVQIGFPGHVEHERKHRELEATVRDIHRRWQAGERQALGEDTLTFLKKWLTEHILGADKAYQPWIEAAAGDGGPAIDAAGGGA
jgi:hemerythrin